MNMEIKTRINNLLQGATGYRIMKTETSYNIIKPSKDKTRLSTMIARKRFNNKPIRVIEVGVFSGENSENILKNMNVEEFIAIDPFAYFGEKYGYEQKILNKAEEKLKKLMQKYPQIKHIKKYSSDAIKEIKGKFDFIYIDGNHRYEYVKKDLENYYPLLKGDGIIGGHDIDLPDVLKAFIEFCRDKKIKNFKTGFGKDNTTHPDWIIYE
jgi:predicted O-methyltransferase YrrM